ncbi:MAG: helix-turn-helix domain-containing protein [Hyphomicrobiaceae bacterium]
MQKFRDVSSRWERREPSQIEAAELLGCSERRFRRYRDRYEEEGAAGLRTGTGPSLRSKNRGVVRVVRAVSTGCGCSLTVYRPLRRSSETA